MALKNSTLLTPPDSTPYYRSLLRSCTTSRSPAAGAALHASLLKCGHLPSPSLAAAIFHFYAALGPLISASLAFSHIPAPSRSTADWTALISAHSRHQPSTALNLFRQMRRANVPPDEVTIISALSATARVEDPALGASLHLLLMKFGLPFTAPAHNAAIDVYAKCGRMVDARRLFNEMDRRTVVSWTVLMAGAIRWEGVSSGREVFERMPVRGDVSWTYMIAGCIEGGMPKEALSLIARMIFSDELTENISNMSLCSLLSTCSQAGDLTVGRWLHTHITKTVPLFDDHDAIMVNTALIDMYGKCGRIGAARKLFEVMPRRNLVCWNAMLGGLSMHGMGGEVLRLFNQMVVEEKQPPDDITFVAVLSACGRSGLVEEGRRMFGELGSVYGLTPKVEHCACMVDLLGRLGRLEEAEDLIREMPMRPNEVVLGSLLASCALHGKLELGRSLLQELLEMEPDNTEYHVLLSNMYTSRGRQAEADDLWQAIKRGGARKGPGISFIEINGYVHRFRAGDRSHPKTGAVYTMLEEVVRRLGLAGYVPCTSSQASRVSDANLISREEQEEEEQALLCHSERLAICFGLINTRPGMSLRIFKNLRICADCHTAVKLISRIFEREIIVRDRNRFHCFHQGVCSCSDYW